MTRTFGFRRLTVASAVCVAAVLALGACGTSNTSALSPSSPTVSVSSAAPTPTPSASPSVATPASSTPSATATIKEVPGTLAPEPTDKPVKVGVYDGDEEFLPHDADIGSWSCPESEDRIYIEDFNKKLHMESSFESFDVEAMVDSEGTTLRITPNNFSAGVVNGEAPFYFPLDKGVSVPAILLPKKDFGEPTDIELCRG